MNQDELGLLFESRWVFYPVLFFSVWLMCKSLKVWLEKKDSFNNCRVMKEGKRLFTARPELTKHNINSKLKLVEILKDLKAEIVVFLVILLTTGLMKEAAILVGTDLDKFVGEQGINSLRIYAVGSLFTQIMLFEAKALKWKLLSLLIQSSMFGVIVSLNCCGDIWQSSLSNTLKVLICIWSMCWVSFYISFRLVLPISKLITSKTL